MAEVINNKKLVSEAECVAIANEAVTLDEDTQEIPEPCLEPPSVREMEELPTKKKRLASSFKKSKFADSSQHHTSSEALQERIKVEISTDLQTVQPDMESDPLV